jgi:hypothetical protein
VRLDNEFISRQRAQIEAAVVPAMEKLYLHDGVEPLAEFRPKFKEIERIVSYYDYWQCGISILAQLVAGDGDGNARALALMEKVRANCDHYRQNIHNHPCPGREGDWTVPLRRLLFHLALAYERLLPVLGEERVAWCRELIEQQVPVAIKHNRDFLPGRKDLYLASVNNHTAIFMQGVYHCGRVLGREDWKDLAVEFAERFYASGHGDGYWEENTNAEREGGPSLVYTRLTAACLYDVLDGQNHPREKFVKAGALFRHLVNADLEMMPIADERTNGAGRAVSYGMALHSTSAEGRGFICELLESMDFDAQTPETLAVLHYELGLMTEGDCAVPESQQAGSFRLTLPLGVLRRGGFTAAASALRALNWQLHPEAHYALDHQAAIYLSHAKAGVILSGIKSKRNPDFSTFRLGEDAYPVRTGKLEMGEDWIEATLHYASFDARVRWDLGETARLTLSTDAAGPVTTGLCIENQSCVRTDANWRVEELPGFSPYTEGNKSNSVKTLVVEWSKELKLEFVIQ